LNTPGGIVDLRTGKLRPAIQEDYCTKISAVAPAGDCPQWLAFLSRITNGDQELQSFMQRMAGYALTGLTREHALFFLYGTGGNGKGVFLRAISGVMGDYAKTAPVETFIDSKSQNHPTDVAGLQGARLVTAIETEEGRRWAESKLKNLTGGDKIAARFMRQNFFEFVPQFKLVVAGNHKPGLRSVDEAIRRRLNLIPFTVTIAPEERDGELDDKLRAEWGGILQWAIDGCLEWQRTGLGAPETVTAATGAYLAEEDTIARWIEDCCEVKRTLWTPATALFDSWRRWAESNQEPAGSQKKFSQALESHGFVSERRRVQAAKNPLRGFLGICIVPDVPGHPVSPVTRARTY
jgi:putative DNA primase/helicase